MSTPAFCVLGGVDEIGPAAILSILVQAQGVAKTSAQLEKLDRTAKQTADSTGNLDKKFSNLDRSVGDFNRTMSAARNTVSLVKFPALIAGAGMATQAVGALAAGAVSLGSALGPLAGAGAAGAAGMVAIGQAAGVAKLATLGLGDAIKGQKGAMDKLSPVQRAFVKDIRALKQETQALRGDAQRGLLPGLDKALGIVTPLITKLRPIVKGTADVMGDLAVSGAKVVRSWGSDLQAVGKTNITVIKNLGTAAIAAADGARHLVVAGGPLLTWLSSGAASGAKWVRAQIAAGRESGRLAGFLEKTRDVMGTLGRIAINLGAALFGIGKAAAPLGRDLLGLFEDLTKKFREWVESATGRNTLDDYFRSAREPILQVAGLIGDVGAAFLRLSNPGPEAGGMVKQLRELVPVLENVIATTTAAFGPVLIESLGNVVRLFGQLAGTSGPLTVFVQLIGVLAGGLADLLASNPALNTMVVSMLGFAGVVKALGLLSLVTGMSALGGVIVGTAAAYRALAAGATVATVAQERGVIATVAARAAVLGTTAAVAAWTTAQWLLNVALTANPIGIVIVGLVALGAAFVVAYTKVTVFRNAVNATFSWISANWPTILAILTGPIGLAVLAIAKNWASIKAAFSSGVSAIVGILRGSVGALGGAGKAMGTALINAFKSALNFAHELAQAMRDLISKAPGYALGVGKAIVTGIVNGIKSAASGIGDAVKGALKGAASAANPFGEGLGKKIGIVPMKGGGSLMGARPSLAPFAAVGAAQGLHVSSGLRPGAMAANGPSYHSSGEAVDLSGPPAGMLKTFQILRSRFGSKLAELIHTPGGVGIKDGKPHTYTGKVAADHFDHVHVAFDTGMPGVGDGPGKMRSAAGIGDGPGKGLHLPAGNFGELASRVWNKATSLMGSPGGMPPVQFAPRLGGGAVYAHFSNSNGRITVSQAMLDAFRDPDSKNHNYALKALVHEYAHARQTTEVHNGPRRLIEGGAEAFAGWASPRIYRALGIPYSYGGGAYESFVNWVIKNKPVKWWQHDQFSHVGGASAKASKATALATPKPRSGIAVAVDAARRAGFSGTDLVNMVAIAARESGYDPTVENLKYPDHSIGLWQINQLAHKGKFGTDAQLKNPYTNAKAAWALFKERKYQPWHGFAGVTKAMFARAREAVLASRKGGSDAGGGAGGGGAGGGGAGAAAGKVSNYEMISAMADTALAAAASTPGLGDDVLANTQLRDATTFRIKQVRKALKNKNLRPATRLRLTQELGGLITKHTDLQGTLKDLRSQPAFDALDKRTGINDAALSIAQGTETLADDLGPLQEKVNILGKVFELTQKKFGAGSAEAAQAFADLTSASQTLAKTQRDALYQPYQQMLTAGSAQLTAAQVFTPGDTSDDLTALNNSLGVATQAFLEAVNRGDTEAINEFGGQVLSLRGSIEQLQASVEQNTQAMLDLQKQQTEDARRLYNVSQSQYGTLAKAIADVASGQIGGRVGLGFMSPSFPGGGSRY